MECPICGHKMEENDAFCSNCGNFALPLQDDSRPVPVIDTPPGTPTEGSAVIEPPDGLQAEEPKPPRKVAQRLYPLPGESEVPGTATAPESAQKQSKPSMLKRLSVKKLRIITAIACALALIAVGVAIYIVSSTTYLQVQLTKAQKESSSAQASAAQLETQVSSLSEQLDTTTAENKTLGEQVASLKSQINDMESSVNQNQYDKDTALRQLEETKAALDSANQEKETLASELSDTRQSLEDTQSELSNTQSELEEARADNASLERQNDELSEQVQSYKAETDFFDEYVVFVMLSSTDKYYHKFSCPNFTQKNFLAYSTRLAEANGYTACPVCGG